MKKKVLSIILALVMVAGMVPFGAIPVFAEEPTPQLIPDFDRDGAISESDRDRSLSGTDTFTIWLNDDDDAEGHHKETKSGAQNDKRNLANLFHVLSPLAYHAFSSGRNSIVGSRGSSRMTVCM